MEKIYNLNKYDENYKIVLRKDTYMNNGTLAVLMVVIYDNGEEEIWSDLTVNIFDSDIMATDKMAFIDTNNNGDDIIQWLVDNGIGHPTGHNGRSGYCVYPLFKFDDMVVEKMQQL